VVSSPRDLAGALDAAAARKLARFIRFGAAFGLPILTLADTPGFLPGTRSEGEAVLCHGAAVIAAYAEASRHVPRVAVVLRRAVGAGSVLAAEADIVLALPEATVAQMGEAALRAAAEAARIPRPEAMTAKAATSPEEAGFAHRTVTAASLRTELIRAFERLPGPRPIAHGERRMALMPL
jgi:acetyl-CoA carboxylase carboxyltransferase component